MGAMYAVTMRHDGGRVTVRIYASSPESAAERVCTLERAPARSVVKVEVSS